MKIADILEKYHPITKKQRDLIETIENFTYEAFEGRDSLDAKAYINLYIDEIKQYEAENEVYHDYGLSFMDFYDSRYYHEEY